MGHKRTAEQAKRSLKRPRSTKKEEKLSKVTSETSFSSNDDNSSKSDLSSESDDNNNINDEKENKENEDASSSKESHENQKKLLQERKKNRKSGIEVEQIKRLWEKLRVRNPPVPSDVRKKLCDETWKLCEGVIGDLVLKHDASRVVQTLVKFSDKERRDKICKELEPYYYKLATSAYGKYLLVKLLHYGSKESRAEIIKSLHGKFRKLLKHKEGAYVLEDMFVLYATSEQQRSILREFWGAQFAFFNEGNENVSIEEACAKSPEQRRIIMRNLAETIKGSVEKGSTGFQVLHAVMKEYVEVFEGEEVRDFIDLVKDQVAEMVHTQQGSYVACSVMAKADPKERKAILKGLKPFFVQMAKNEYGHTVLQTIFMTMDDTRFVKRSFYKEFSENVGELVTDKYARRPFLYLLNGLDKSFFSPKAIKELEIYVKFSKETSKKPQEKRRTEILNYFLPAFYKYFEEHPYELLSENMGSQFVLEVLMNNDDLQDDFSKDRAKALNITIDCVRGDLTKEEHLIHKKYTERLLKTLVQGGKWNRDTKSVQTIDGLGIGFEYAKNITEELFLYGSNLDSLKMWIANSGSAFVLVGLVDSFKHHKEDKNVTKFLDTLEDLSTFIQEQDENNKGAHLLNKVLS